MLRQLEREKHVLEGKLKDLEWRLDSESQVGRFMCLSIVQDVMIVKMTLGDFHQNGPNTWFYESSFLKILFVLFLLFKRVPLHCFRCVKFFSPQIHSEFEAMLSRTGQFCHVLDGFV